MPRCVFCSGSINPQYLLSDIGLIAQSGNNLMVKELIIWAKARRGKNADRGQTELNASA